MPSDGFLRFVGATVSRRMRAARFYGPGQPLALEDVPIPEPAVGEALVRVRMSGVCHTELHMLEGVLNLGVVPLIPGHEVVGEVVEVRGPSRSVPGERVLLSYYAPCGSCSLCRGGAENLCPNASRQLGFTADGGYGEYVVVPSSSMLSLPSNLDDEEAVGLACGGATALHAARAVAQVRLGETAVIYGVGGVGFYLIQICRMAGARVLAIGRNPTKLAIAKDLGADAGIDAMATDPLTAVQELTNGNGADVVFDLVASAETMAIAPRMLARRGRLVFAGYGEDHATLNPLLLVLREIQIRGAVGNTFAELRDTVSLAASGRLKSVVGPLFPLERVNDALAALRDGQVVGRAILVPELGDDLALLSDAERGVKRDQGLASSPSRSPGLKGTSAESGAADERCELTPDCIADTVALKANVGRLADDGTNGDANSCISSAGPPSETDSVARPAASSVQFLKTSVEDVIVEPGNDSRRFDRSVTVALSPRPGPRPFEAELLEFITRGVDAPCDDGEFNALALGLFAYQFANNEPYRRFCAIRGVSPELVRHWTEIPAVPIGGFKEAVLACESIDNAAALFMSSGTTRPEQRSRHYHPHLAVYNASIRTNFAAHLLPDNAQLPFLVLNPPPSALPNSSLAYYLGMMLETYGASGGGYFVGDDGLHYQRLLDVVRQLGKSGQPVCLLGTTFAFVHLLDRLADDGICLELPPGSRAFDTGGVKGRSREISRDELAHALETRLGISRGYQVNMYGLTELSTQFIDVNVRQTVRSEPLRPFKSVPPWARTRVLDPETLEEVPPGTPGVLCHTDLANRASVCTVLTEDLGVVRGDGFEILGRVQGSSARGCSIAMDELLSATGGGR